MKRETFGKHIYIEKNLMCAKIIMVIGMKITQKNLPYNYKKIINKIALKVYNGELNISEAQQFLKEKLDVKAIHFSLDSKIVVVTDEYSQVLLCYENFEQHNINDNTYGKIRLSSDEKKEVLSISLLVLKGELSVEEANTILKNKMDIEYVTFANSGKIFVKIDEKNSEFYKYTPEYIGKIKNSR